MSQTLPISEVKARLPELVTGVEEREEEIVVTRKGKPAAVLVNYAEYERLKETLDVLSTPALMQQIRSSQRFYAKGGKGLSFEEVFGEPLRRELEGLWKYRVRRFRVAYAIDRTRSVIRIVAIGHRRGIYEVINEQLHRSKRN